MWFGAFLRSPAWTALVWIFKGLFPLPANAGLGVFENDACLQQLLADLVRASEVLALLGSGPLGDQRIHFRVGKRASVGGRREHFENVVELLQELQRRGG